MHTVEFADIRIRAALPLHPYLHKHPHLFLRLAVDGGACGDTAGVDGDLTRGVWEFSAKLYANRLEQSLNVTVLTGVKGPGIQVVSVTLKVAELLARVKACRNDHQDFDIFDSSTPIQLKLIMTCSIKLSFILGRVPQTVGDKCHTINSRSENNESDFDPERMHLLSREDLESLYVKTSYMADQDDSKARQLSLLGYRFHVLYAKEHEKADLQKAISIQEESMRFTGLSHSRLAERADHLAMALLERFQQSRDHTDIERAISYSQIALRFTEDLDTAKPFQLCNLGNALQLRFQRFGVLADLENSILYQREAIRLIPDGDPEEPSRFNNLGLALRSRFERLGGLADLEGAISNLRQAAQLTLDNHPERPSRFNNLALALQSRFERLGGLSDLEDAISKLRQAVQLAPDDHLYKPGLLSNLGIALQSRFERVGDLIDLEDSISSHWEAVQLTLDDHPDRPRRFNNLGLALQSRFKRLGDIVDLEDAISKLRQAVQLMPDGHLYNAKLFNNLGLALRSRFERLGVLTDLEDAVSNHRQAVPLMPDGHLDKPSLFNNLGVVLQSRFECLGALTDLEDAISNHRQAVLLTPDGHHDKPSRFNSLGLALRSRFERLGVLTDLEDAISNYRQAVPLMPDAHCDKPGLFDNLGLTLQSRFERLGDLADLEDSISNHRQAVQLTPDGHPERPSGFNNLGLALQSRFERLGGLSDLEDAISNLRQAVQLMPDGHLYNAKLFNNLGIALRCRFERLGVLTDLEDSISNHRKAVTLMRDDHPEKPSLFSNLGIALRCRFKRLGVLADLEDAMSCLQQVFQLTPDGHPNKPGRFGGLGLALLSRFERLDDLADLEDAISKLRQAVQLTPDGHPERPSRLQNLGGAFVHRFGRLNVLSDLESAVSTFSTAANSTIGSALVRFRAARTWAKAAEVHSRSPLDAFNCAINLLPRIAWLGLAVPDQHALLADVGSIVRDAVAAAIRYEEYEAAVVWAEQGRSIVWQNLLGLRSPVDDLRDTHPELADRLQIIAKQLEGSGSHLEASIASAGDVSVNYSKLAIEWDNIVEEVRRIPRFGDFLKAKSFRQLVATAAEGPVVILNVNGAQCDALALISDESVECKFSVVHIPLERFSYEKSEKLFQTLTKLLSSAGVRERNDRKTGRAQSQVDSEAKFKAILSILWKDVVKPVIEGLAFQIEPKRPPRIWWCVTGLLTFLPIHAAGLYDTPELGERISDYVVSSYTPTLSAILELSDREAHEGFQVLMVAQASAPGAQPIPKTEEEVRIIHGLTAGARRVNLMREDATVERVREEMMKSNWIHLACHGQQNPDDPMESGFLLHDKILKLSEIVKMSLPKADFAFLSACQTAMGDEKVAEESVHLAAGMLLSGCQGVVATTWSIRDEDGPKIADDVYSRIFKDEKPNRKEAAYALHEAVERLRESGAHCTSWVPFIHIGR